MNEQIDYADSGLKINRAVQHQMLRFPDKSLRPDHILWSGRAVKIYDWVDVSRTGKVRFEFISSKEGIDQGFDAKLDGWFELEKMEKVPLLRTWKDDRYEDVVEYPFLSRDGRMGIWNIYKETLPSGEVIEDKLGGNSGFWIESVSKYERIYHCSPAMLDPPDFEALVFKLLIFPTI